MVWIPAGSVEGFWMDQYEVTNEAFARFVAENPRWAPGASNPDIGPRYLSHWINGAPTSGEARKPVNRVNLAAARAYAEWAGKRLPTDRQWVWAARAHQLTDFWWGAVPDPAKANLQTGVLQPVGSLDEPHPFKLYDILGNVMEWTVDETLRGGGFKSLPGYARLTSSAVYERNRMTFDEQYGFRCVLVR